jgi:hypothetical protein
MRHCADVVNQNGILGPEDSPSARLVVGTESAISHHHAGRPCSRSAPGPGYSSPAGSADLRGSYCMAEPPERLAELANLRA